MTSYDMFNLSLTASKYFFVQVSFVLRFTPFESFNRVTEGLRPLCLTTDTSPARSKAARPRYPECRLTPNIPIQDIDRRTTQVPFTPAQNHNPIPTCRALPGCRAACSNHFHGIGPLRNLSPFRCRGCFILAGLVEVIDCRKRSFSRSR